MDQRERSEAAVLGGQLPQLALQEGEAHWCHREGACFPNRDLDGHRHVISYPPVGSLPTEIWTTEVWMGC